MTKSIFGGNQSGRSKTTKERVKTARRRSPQSARWLERQLNDPYVKRAQADGFRSRAAYKLIELDEKYGFLKGKKAVIDLGMAPGGWTQVVRKRLPSAKVVGIDLLPVDPVEDVVIFEMDFMDDAAPDRLSEALGQAPDLVISDMAANTVGHRQTDHLRTMGLGEAAADFAIRTLETAAISLQRSLLVEPMPNCWRCSKPISRRSNMPSRHQAAKGQLNYLSSRGGKRLSR